MNLYVESLHRGMPYAVAFAVALMCTSLEMYQLTTTTVIVQLGGIALHFQLLPVLRAGANTVDCEL